MRRSSIFPFLLGKPSFTFSWRKSIFYNLTKAKQFELQGIGSIFFFFSVSSSSPPSPPRFAFLRSFSRVFVRLYNRPRRHRWRRLLSLPVVTASVVWSEVVVERVSSVNPRLGEGSWTGRNNHDRGRERGTNRENERNVTMDHFDLTTENEKYTSL